MLELLALMVLVPVGIAVAAVVLVVGGLLHLLGRVLLLPFALLAGLLKLLVLLPLALVALLVVGPILLGVGLVLLLSVLILGGFVWGVTRLASA